MKNKLITDLSVIKGVTTLMQLAQYDENIRAFAVMKIQDKFLADDIVNDMYVKLYDVMSKGKELNGGYVVMTINSIWMNKIKFEERYNDEEHFGDADEFESDSRTYQSLTKEIADNDDFEEIMTQKLDNEEKYEYIKNLLDERLTDFEKDLLRHSLTMTLLEISKRSTIPYYTIRNHYKLIKEKLNIKKNMKEKKPINEKKVPCATCKPATVRVKKPPVDPKITQEEDKVLNEPISTEKQAQRNNVLQQYPYLRYIHRELIEPEIEAVMVIDSTKKVEDIKWLFDLNKEVFGANLIPCKCPGVIAQIVEQLLILIEFQKIK